LNGAGNLAPRYADKASDDDYSRISALGGEYLDDIDTPLETALISTCAGVIDVRPAEAVKMLGTGREADLKLGAAAYMEMQAARFLGGDPAPYAAALKFITDRGRVTEADIRGFMAQGIAAAVDAEFNETIFLMDRRYNAVLTRDSETGSYTLNYEDAIYVTKQITAPSLNALLTEMKSGTNRADFNQNCIDQVAAENANIPVIFLGKLGKDPRPALTDIITAFYLNPTNQTVYGAMRDVNVFYDVAAGVSDNPANREMYETIGAAYINTLTALSPELKQRVINDSRSRTSVTLPAEARRRLQL
jgi:hypothetical protein